MQEEAPSFSSKPLEDEIGNSEIKVKTKVRKTVRKTRPKSIDEVKPKRRIIQDFKQEEIDKQLTSIYQDSNGQLPDMKKIKIRKSHSILKLFFIIIIAGGLLAGAAWAGFFLMPTSKNFSEDQIALSAEGPTDIVAGVTTTYTINYENKQGLPLNNATLNIQYPEGFIFVSSDLPAKNSGHTEWSIGKIAPHKKGKMNITGITYGSIGQQQSWRIFLTYRPENFNSDLQKAYILNVAFGKSPFSLSLTGPDKATIGNSAEYKYTVKKEDLNQIKKLELKPNLPANFFITSSSPALSKNNTWVFDPSKTGTSTSNSWIFKVAGKFSSSSDQIAPIQGTLNVPTTNASFKIAESKITTELIQNNLDFSLAINGSITNTNAQPGSILNITINLKNLSGNDLKNATLKLDLDAPSVKRQSALDWSQIADKYDGDIQGIQLNDTVRRGEIVWNKTKIPDLTKISPNQEVNLDLRLPIKDVTSFDFTSLKSSLINALAEVSFTDQTGAVQSYSANPISINLSSDLKFETRDTVSSDEKTHSLTWVLTNNFHPLKNLVLSADVYGDVEVKIDTAPAGQVNFDTKIKRITWTIPEMPEGVDVLALPFTINIKSINPSQDTLISKVHVQADDTITGQKLDFMGDEILVNKEVVQ